MLRLRGSAAIALAIAALFGLTTVAQAATVAKLDLSLSPSKAGTKKKPRAAKLNFAFTLGTDDGTSPATAKEVVVSFGKGIRFNSARFPSCTLAILNTKGPKACPKGSKVGTGSAVALVGGTPGEPPPSTTETLKITTFNGPKGKTYLLFLDGDSPAPIKQALVGKLSRAGGAYGYKLDVTIPANLQQPITGVFAPLVDFKIKTGATYTKTRTVTRKGKRTRVRTRYNYIETYACPARSWPFRAALTFGNDPLALSPTTSQACR